MIRRSRISVRPNVRSTGRVPATSRDAAQDNKTDHGNDPGGDVEAPEVSAVNKLETECGDQTSQSESNRSAA